MPGENPGVGTELGKQFERLSQVDGTFVAVGSMRGALYFVHQPSISVFRAARPL